MVCSDNSIDLAIDSLEAEPLSFFLDPYILSFFGAGVWASDFLPALFGKIFFYKFNFLFFYFVFSFQTNKTKLLWTSLTSKVPTF
jgi:hypothetical protein